MGGAVFCPVDCLAWGIPALEPTGFWVGPGLGAKILASRRSHTNEYYPILLLPVSLSPDWGTAALTSAGDPPRAASRSGSGSYEVTAFVLGPGVDKTLCAVSKSGVSVSPSPVELPRWPSKPNALGAPPPDARPTGCEGWHGAQNSHSCGRTPVI